MHSTSLTDESVLILLLEDGAYDFPEHGNFLDKKVADVKVFQMCTEPESQTNLILKVQFTLFVLFKVLSTCINLLIEFVHLLDHCKVILFKNCD